MGPTILIAGGRGRPSGTDTRPLGTRGRLAVGSHTTTIGRGRRRSGARVAPPVAVGLVGALVLPVFLYVQVKNGKFARLYPKQGFACTKDVVTVPTEF